MTLAHTPLRLTGEALDLASIEQVARLGRAVALAPAALDRLERSHRALHACLESGAAIYGVNTGFGSLARQRLSGVELREVQHNLLRSHAAGTGDALPDDTVRAMLVLLAGSLARGHSGVRPQLARAVVDLLNAGVVPVVPSLGSVGASGDLAPLAHAALVLLGEGRARVRGVEMPGGDALSRAGLSPLSLEAKEGLALINGTHLMAAQAALILSDVDRVFDAALCACAMSIDALRATDAFLDERIHWARRQPGQRRVAARLRGMLSGSQIIPSHQAGDPRVQDPYSLRCAPQILGPALDAIDHVRALVQHELGAVTDNPLVFAGTSAESAIAPTVRSGGNFHGLALAMPLDHLALALCHIAGVSERRVYLMLAATDPESHLRPHLSPRPGLHSGLMITQYTAAALCNELIGLAAPASAANIPTCAGMEDYNSFGPRSAAKARRGVELAARVVAIEFLCAAQALETHRPLRSGALVEQAHATVRDAVAPLGADRPPAPDIEALASLVLQGRFGD